MLRATGQKLTCYLNCENAGGMATTVKLPEECDTLEEVLIKVQARMQLDQRMLYASELYDVHGNVVRNMRQLSQLSLVDAPIMVGCGEPFDPTRIPFDLLELQKEGGGRKGSKKVHNNLREKRLATLREKAEKVREAGHGINSEAVAIARLNNVAQNREHVEEMRHKYMESLLIRAAQQEDLLVSVKTNMALHKMEAAESRQRLEERKAEKLAQLAAERRVLREERQKLRSQALESRQAQAAQVRASTAVAAKSSRSPQKGGRARTARAPGSPLEHAVAAA